MVYGRVPRRCYTSSLTRHISPPLASSQVTITAYATDEYAFSIWFLPPSHATATPRRRYGSDRPDRSQPVPDARCHPPPCQAAAFAAVGDRCVPLSLSLAPSPREEKVGPSCLAGSERNEPKHDDDDDDTDVIHSFTLPVDQLSSNRFLHITQSPPPHHHPLPLPRLSTTTTTPVHYFHSLTPPPPPQTCSPP